jgi:t-SNARE complex subunit (syntaxin)
VYAKEGKDIPAGALWGIKQDGGPNEGLDGRPSRSSAAHLNFELQMSLMEEDNQARGVVIDKVIGNLHTLNQIFKEISRLALEQGTVIDRIDYNIEQMCKNTGKAKEELRKFNQNQSGTCANRVIIIQLVIIFVLAIICILKYIL